MNINTHSIALPTSINPDWRIGIVHSAFYAEEMATLTKGAVDTLAQAGIHPSAISVHAAAGSFEVPLIGAALAKTAQVDALIGLGLIIEGETHHARLLAEAATRGIMDIQLAYQIPFAFEILYADSIDMIHARLHKGEEAARSVLHSLAKLQALRSDSL